MATHDTHLTDEDLITALRRSASLETPPPWLLAQAQAIWQPTPRPAQAGPGLARWIAQLVSDFTAPPLALGLRSAGGGERQVLCTAEGLDIELRIAPDDSGRWRLSGQVLGSESLHGVTLDDGSSQHAGIVSDQSEFRFDALASGRWRIELQTDAATIELPTLEIAAPDRDAI